MSDNLIFNILDSVAETIKDKIEAGKQEKKRAIELEAQTARKKLWGERIEEYRKLFFCLSKFSEHGGKIVFIDIQTECDSSLEHRYHLGNSSSEDSSDIPIWLSDMVIHQNEFTELIGMKCWMSILERLDRISLTRAEFDFLNNQVPWFIESNTDKITVSGDTYNDFKDLTLSIDKRNLKCIAFTEDIALRNELTHTTSNVLAMSLAGVLDIHGVLEREPSTNTNIKKICEFAALSIPNLSDDLDGQKAGNNGFEHENKTSIADEKHSTSEYW